MYYTTAFLFFSLTILLFAHTNHSSHSRMHAHLFDWSQILPLAVSPYFVFPAHLLLRHPKPKWTMPLNSCTILMRHNHTFTAAQTNTVEFVPTYAETVPTYATACSKLGSFVNIADSGAGKKKFLPVTYCVLHYYKRQNLTTLLK